VAWALDQEKIVGFKDSSGDLVYFRKMRHLAETARPDWSFLVGPEELLAEVGPPRRTRRHQRRGEPASDTLR
jgi:dihydrodipicolinate synthase/N-acetylneuraminate lyase